MVREWVLVGWELLDRLAGVSAFGQSTLEVKWCYSYAAGFDDPVATGLATSSGKQPMYSSS